MTEWRDLPPLAALRAFGAWAEAGSMTGAGRTLNVVSHAAVSQQIRALEVHLGLTLIERAEGGARLTPEGLRLAEAVTAGFGGMARVVAELTGRDADRPVQVTTTAAFAAAWLLPRLARFRAAHPEVSLMVEPSAERRVLAPGGFDLALRYGDGNWPGVEARPLLLTPLVVVAAPALIEGVADGDLAALADLPWLQELGTVEASEFLLARGLARGEAQGILSMPGGMIFDAVRDGQGLAVIARDFVAADIASGWLRALHEFAADKGYWLVTRPAPLRRPARAFVKWALREAGQSGDGL